MPQGPQKKFYYINPFFSVLSSGDEFPPSQLSMNTAHSDIDSSSGTSLCASDTDPSSTCHSIFLYASSPEILSQELSSTEPPVTPNRPTDQRVTEDESTPTQASVTAHRNAYVRSWEHNNDHVQGTQDPFDSDATKSVETSFYQTLHEGAKRRGMKALARRPAPKPSPEMLRNFVFIYPSSEHANHTREVHTEPKYGFLFSSLPNLTTSERQFYVFLPSVEKPLCFYSNKRAVLSHLLRWLETSGSNKPLSLRIRCTDPLEDESIEDVLQILFGRHHANKWHDVDLQLNDFVSERFLPHPAQAFNIVHARLNTKNCSMKSSLALFFRLERLPNLQELVYSYDPVHFFPSEVHAIPLWRQLNYIDLGARLDEVECVAFLAQCIQASTITLRWLMNSDDINIQAPANRSITILPRLRSLDIVASHYDTTLVLQHFTFPALETLAFAMRFSEMTQNRLAGLLLRSRAPLRKINIFDALLSPTATEDVVLAVVVGTATPPVPIHTISPRPQEFQHTDELDGQQQQLIERTVVESLGIFSSQIKKGGNLVEAWNRTLEWLKCTDNGECRGLVVPPLEVFGGSWGFGNRRKRIGWGERPLFL